HPAIPDLPHPGHPHPRRPTTVAELPTRLALDHPHPGDLSTPLRAANPHLTRLPARASNEKGTHRVENGAHRGDTRRVCMPPGRKPHPRHANHSRTSTNARSRNAEVCRAEAPYRTTGAYAARRRAVQPGRRR